QIAKNGKKMPPAAIAFYKQTDYSLEDLVSKDPAVDILEEFSKKISEFKPSLIAVSSMTTNYYQSLEMIQKIRPKCKVIFGGVHPTLMPESVINEDVIDYVCVGEADEALVELCEYLDKNKDTSNIRNLYLKVKKGRKVIIIKNKLRPFVNLDTLPPPDLSIFDHRYFFRPFLGKIYKGIYMSTARGCPRGCAYCVNNRLRNIYKECGRRYIRFQSPKIIARNITYIKKKYGINWYKFSDDTFLLRPLADLLKLKKLLKPLHIMFGCSVDPVTVTEEKVKAAKEMGCVSMSMGIETGNEKIRKYVLGRNISNNQIFEAVRIMRKYNIKISTFNMIGLPGETKENIFETIKLNKKLNIPDANVYVMYPFPGTKIYEDFHISRKKFKNIPAMEEAYLFNLSNVKNEELLYFLRTFNLYLVLPEKYWQKIEKARKSPKLYTVLIQIAQEIINKNLD
ncbi:MAG: hypothetical protein A2163_10005, partial [Actinobacteria bacterium RBG_13_35_12]